MVSIKFLLELLIIKSSDRSAILLLLVYFNFLNHDVVDLPELSMRFQKVPLRNFHRLGITDFVYQLLPNLLPGNSELIHSLVVFLLIQFLVALQQQFILLTVPCRR